MTLCEFETQVDRLQVSQIDMDVQKKTFVALLRAISREQLGEPTSADMITEIFQVEDMDESRAEEIYSSLSQTFKELVSNNSQPAQLKDILQERGDLSEEQVQLFVQFWTNEGPKHHAKVIERASFARKLAPSGFKWRVDQVTNVKNLSEISQTVAVVELVTKEVTKTERKLAFEVDKDTLNSVVEQLDLIQKRIESFV
jgi:Ni,Fe-hydrogenase III component G